MNETIHKSYLYTRIKAENDEQIYNKLLTLVKIMEQGKMAPDKLLKHFMQIPAKKENGLSIKKCVDEMFILINGYCCDGMGFCEKEDEDNVYWFCPNI